MNKDILGHLIFDANLALGAGDEPLAKELIGRAAFISGLMQLRDANGGQLPPMPTREQWDGMVKQYEETH